MAPKLQALTRRRALAASGALAAAPLLAACGAEPQDSESDPAEQAELLNDVLAHQLAVLGAARKAGPTAPKPAARAIATLTKLREGSTRELAASLEELEGEPAGEPAERVPAESPVESLARQIESAIGATLAVIGELDPERRIPIQRALTEDAGTLAVLQHTLGEEVATEAFVLGAAPEAGS